MEIEVKISKNQLIYFLTWKMLSLGNDDIWPNNRNNSYDNFDNGNDNFGSSGFGNDRNFGYGNDNSLKNGNFERGNDGGNFRSTNSGGIGTSLRGFGVNSNYMEGSNAREGNFEHISNENSMGAGYLSSNFGGLGNENKGNITSDTSNMKNDKIGGGASSIGGGSTCSGSMTGNTGSTNMNNFGNSQSGNGNAVNLFAGGYGSGMSNRPSGTRSTGYGALNTLGFGGLSSGNLGNNFGGGNFGEAYLGGKNNLGGMKNTANETYCVRLRGLPYSSNEEDIHKVFVSFNFYYNYNLYDALNKNSGKIKRVSLWINRISLYILSNRKVLLNQ